MLTTGSLHRNPDDAVVVRLLPHYSLPEGTACVRSSSTLVVRKLYQYFPTDRIHCANSRPGYSLMARISNFPSFVSVKSFPKSYLHNSCGLHRCDDLFRAWYKVHLERLRITISHQHQRTLPATLHAHHRLHIVVRSLVAHLTSPGTNGISVPSSIEISNVAMSPEINKNTELSPKNRPGQILSRSYSASRYIDKNIITSVSP